MLDRDEAFAVRQPDIFRRHVVLEVDKALALGPDLEHRRRTGVTGQGLDNRVRHWRNCCADRRKTCVAAVQYGFEGPEMAVEGAGACPLLRRLRRQEGLQRLVPLRFGAGLAGEVNGRRPAARHQQAVGMDASFIAAQRPGDHVETLHLDAGERLAALSGDHGVAGEDLGLGFRRQLAHFG